MPATDDNAFMMTPLCLMPAMNIVEKQTLFLFQHSIDRGVIIKMIALNDITAINKSESNLSLVKDERIGDILFLIASIIALISTYQAEKEIISKKFNKESLPDDSAYYVAAASWTFFISSIILAYVAIARYCQFATADPDVSPLTLKSRKYSAIGNIISVIGFCLTAIGDQLKAKGSSSGGPTISR
ncbi:hypothetical protein [Desulfosporosinus shakirovi]|uniref:hypothetical protein n=1 Tax=Desulfosporosinus shakirovi TaxID=2885154 RepID=UPI001E346DE5|nr:hypothetical protein [Desulfosporosinus sp. SRJS8]MCB8814626.1 hypothetical protein [Desulfosporosinus sp. SRJS8]